MTKIGNWMKMYCTLFVLLLLYTCPSSAHAESKITLATYNFQYGELTIGLPVTWEKEEQDVGQGFRMLAASSPKEVPSDFMENINVIVVPADRSNLKDATTRGINMMKRNMAQFELVDQGSSQMGANDVAWFIHTFNFQGNTLKVLKVMIINGKRMYIFSGTALPDTFSQYRVVFDKIVSSIEFEQTK